MSKSLERGTTPSVNGLDNLSQSYWNGAVKNWNDMSLLFAMCVVKMNQEEREDILKKALLAEKPNESEEVKQFTEFSIDISQFSEEALEKIGKAIFLSFKDKFPNG